MKLTDLKKMTPSALQKIRGELEGKQSRLVLELKALKKSARAVSAAEAFHAKSALEKKRAALGLRLVDALDRGDSQEAARVRTEISALKA